jgi:hypothetical protein
MRDDHLDRYHQTKETDRIPAAIQPDLDSDEIQPLLFDLVQTDDVDAVRALLPSWKPNHDTVQRELSQLAASFGSPTLVDMLRGAGIIYRKSDMVAAAINHGNTETLHCILEHESSVSKNPELFNFCVRAIEFVLRSESCEVYDLWEKYMTIAEFRSDTPLRNIYRISDAIAASYFTQKRVLQWTAGFPNRVQFLLNAWVKRDIIRRMGSSYCGDTLVNIARISCDIDMAKALLRGGVKVDYRRSDHYASALHHAARKTTVEAAELVKFLLLCGANPDLESSRSKMKIRDEKGAKNISKHLGVSWDELVAQTKKQREEFLSQGSIDANSEEALTYFARLASSHDEENTGEQTI